MYRYICVSSPLRRDILKRLCLYLIYKIKICTDISMFSHHGRTDIPKNILKILCLCLIYKINICTEISVFPYHGRTDRKNSDHIITSTPPHSQPVFSGFSRLSYSVFEISFKLPPLSFPAGHSVPRMFQVPKMFSWFVFQPSSCSLPSFSILHQLLVPQLLHPFDCWFPNCSPLRLFLPRSWTPSLENVPLVIAGSLLPVSSRSSHRKTSHLTLLSTLHFSRSSKPPSLQLIDFIQRGRSYQQGKYIWSVPPSKKSPSLQQSSF